MTLPLLSMLAATATATAASTSTVALIDPTPAACGSFSRIEPKAAGLDRRGLERLVRDAEASRTDALIVLLDDRCVVDRRFGKPGPIETMSVTKSVVSLAIGMLIAEGKIRAVSEPLSTWFPEWAKGEKAKVTLEHLLTQRSGLDHQPFAGRLYAQPDMVRYARGLPMLSAPGEVFSYSNEATQLLSAIVRAAAKKPLDLYLDEKLFKPLGIRGYTWRKDRAGNLIAFSDLALEPIDLAKIGVLMLRRGRWGDRQLLTPEWVHDASTPLRILDRYGYLWWARYAPEEIVQEPMMRENLERSGFTAAVRLGSLDRRVFHSWAEYWLEVGALLSGSDRAELASRVRRGGPTAVHSRFGPQIGFYANGWLGQYLIVHPKEKLVVVRLRRATDGNDELENNRYGFGAIHDRIEALLER